jgi:hypothetical protein
VLDDSEGEAMKHLPFSLLCCCLLSPMALLANDGTPQGSGSVSLTPDQAIAAAHSFEHRHREYLETKDKGATSFEVIREIDANAQTRKVALQAREAAASLHVKVHEEYGYLGLLERGGYLLLQTEGKTGNALALYLVSSKPYGRRTVVARPLLGEKKMSGSTAKELIAKNAEFVDRLYDTPLRDVGKLKSHCEGGHFPEYGNEDEVSYFGIPRIFRKTDADEDAVQELAGLMGAFTFWWTRYAVSFPVYAANPMYALKTALDKHEALVKEFMQKNKQDPKFTYDPEGLVTAHTPAQLPDLIALYRRVDDFLESKAQSQCATPTFAVNKSLSTIALQLGLDTTFGKDTYAAVTEPALEVGWKRGGNGDWAVMLVVSVAESSDFADK